METLASSRCNYDGRAATLRPHTQPPAAVRAEQNASCINKRRLISLYTRFLHLCKYPMLAILFYHIAVVITMAAAIPIRRDPNAFCWQKTDTVYVSQFMRLSQILNAMYHSSALCLAIPILLLVEKKGHRQHGAFSSQMTLSATIPLSWTRQVDL